MALAFPGNSSLQEWGIPVCNSGEFYLAENNQGQVLPNPQAERRSYRLNNHPARTPDVVGIRGLPAYTQTTARVGQFSTGQVGQLSSGGNTEPVFVHVRS